MYPVQTAIRKAIAWPYIGRAVGLLVLLAAAIGVYLSERREVREAKRQIRRLDRAQRRAEDAAIEADDARARRDLYAAQMATKRRQAAQRDAIEAQDKRDRAIRSLERAQTAEATADAINRILGL